jgi:hypothetical protein
VCLGKEERGFVKEKDLSFCFLIGTVLETMLRKISGRAIFLNHQRTSYYYL